MENILPAYLTKDFLDYLLLCALGISKVSMGFSGELDFIVSKKQISLKRVYRNTGSLLTSCGRRWVKAVKTHVKRKIKAP